MRLPPDLRDYGGDELSARTALVRGRLECVGPVTSAALAATLGLAEKDVGASLSVLEGEGVVLRGRSRGGSGVPRRGS